MVDSLKKQAVDAIKRKLVGHELTYADAYALMHEFSSGNLGDIFVAYFAASGFRNGYSDDELYFLTKAMVETGECLHFPGIVADKHSIGGLPGTRATMIIVPIIAAAGYVIPKTSARAITTPAGTADCMEVLAPVTFDAQHTADIVHKTGGCIVWGGHVGMAPADDVIIRVQEPLGFESFDKVMVSVLAKKIAAGATHVVIDIPVGPTMKMKYVKDALLFRNRIVSLAKKFHVTVVCDVNFQLQPAGRGIGPTYETLDVIRILRQNENRPLDLEWKALRLAGTLLDLCFAADNRSQDGLLVAEHFLYSGKAYKKFHEIVVAQGGSGELDIAKIPVGKHKHVVYAKHEGILSSVNNYNVTALAKILGAPTIKTAGLVLHKRIDDIVKKGDPLITLYAENKKNIEEAVDTIESVPLFAIS